MSTALTATRAAASRAVFKASIPNVMPSRSFAVDAQSPKIMAPRFPRHLRARRIIDKMHNSLYGVETVSKAEVQPVSQRIKKARQVRRELLQPNKPKTIRPKIQIYAAKPAIKTICPDPVATITSSQISLLDPTGARTRLFSKDNPECARVGDILLVRQRTGDPFAGVCINIRRRGADTAILLRGQLTRVGVEMWYKIYSPLVEGIEVVQRAAKRARRARLTYMRTEKHDRGSVEKVVRMYLRQKMALGTAGGAKKKGAPSGAHAPRKGGKKGKKR